ncbi:ATP-binding protein [Streptomyces sp. NPDC048664]|uniref:ATP-binding protein n=1 Tax=Streptomyces sp. NPDC048664 TaxID=3154505 RepID=UPI003414D630
MPAPGPRRGEVGQERTAGGCAHHAPTAEGTPPASAQAVTSAASARAHVLALLRGRTDGDDTAPPASADQADQAVTDLLLVTSELVSNAFRHGGGLVAFQAAVTPEGVRIGVHDRSGEIPPVAFGSGALPVGHQGGGYGWPLIIKLARDISIERCAAGGKVVSVLVPLAPPF